MDLTTQTPAEIDSKLFPILDEIARVEYKIASNRKVIEGNHGERVIEAAKKRQGENEAELADLEEKAFPYEEEWRERGWTRYVVVPGGHLHWRFCHTLTPGRTMIGQVAEASGLAPGEVVGKYGEGACTHCFPDAPVVAKKTPAEEGFCPKSGEFLTDAEYGAGRRYCRCPECGELVSVTGAGKFRKHKAAG